MNQDQVVHNLLLLDSKVPDFIVTFTGKNSDRVDGLYKPDSCEIIIHNKNHETDNALMYTAIHEFAHHVQFTGSAKPVTSRAHTTDFWNTFHRLLERAEELGIYTNVFESEEEFIVLTKQIKQNYLHENGRMMKEMASILFKAFELCSRFHVSFDDYMDRVIGLHRSTARTILKMQTMDIDPSIGFENMKVVASVKDETVRAEVEKAFLKGSSPDMVKAMLAGRKPENRLDYLLEEKERLEKMLESVTVRLAKVEREIENEKYV